MGKKFKKREKHNLVKLLQICENIINYKYERPIIINGIINHSNSRSVSNIVSKFTAHVPKVNMMYVLWTFLS